jgi:predicted 3-demethylubiquinone-9 3-methyltransferase (glyoxalase superfamily)
MQDGWPPSAVARVLLHHVGKGEHRGKLGGRRSKETATTPTRRNPDRLEKPMSTLRKIIPCLWFDGQAEEAATFYVSVFERSRITRIARYGEVGQEIHGGKPGSVMTVAFELDGVPFTALNGGPQFTFNQAISLQVMCETQEEIDRYWSKLGAGGDEKAQQCGWLTDKYGLAWQIVPAVLPDLVADKDPAKAGRVMGAIFKMKKLDIATLKRAHAG